MEASVISNDVLARYASDSALEVEGISRLTQEAVEISGGDGSFDIDIHVELEWGAAAEAVGRLVQERVAEYVERMASVEVGSVDVLVDRVGAPPAKR